MDILFFVICTSSVVWLICQLFPTALIENKKPVLFSTLALGSRFKFSPESDDVWVKLGYDAIIAKWDEKFSTDKWVGQPICSLNDDRTDQEVYYVR